MSQRPETNPKPRLIRVAVVTGSRADFGLLLPVIQAMIAQPTLLVEVIVTGTHLSLGTWRDIPGAGVPIAAKITMQSKSRSANTRVGDVQALARGVAGLGRVFQKMNPDWVMILGDRIEAMAAATAASVGGYRIAHLHGGDRAEGVADEAMRHAISKMAHLHLAATKQSARRLVRMGEAADFVSVVGSPAIDGLLDVQPDPDAPQVILLRHPVGASNEQEATWMRWTLQATANYCRLVLAPNGDPGSDGIRQALRDANVPVVAHLPRPAFLAKLAGCRMIVGNSSAGLIEAAALNVPCVNLGCRQNGREKPANVIDADDRLSAIRQAIGQALAMDHRRLRHPYGDGHTGWRVAQILATLDPASIPLKKQNAY